MTGDGGQIAEGVWGGEFDGEGACFIWVRDGMGRSSAQ